MGDAPVGCGQRDRPVVPGAVRRRFGGLDYDFFLLFGPDAVWEQTPPRPASSGATVIGERERLARDLTPLLD